MEQIIIGLSNEAYHHEAPYSEYLSSSQLKRYAVSPKAFKFALDHPEPQTDAMRFGSLFHDLMACSAEHYDNGTKAIAEWMRHIAIFDPPKNEKTGQLYGSTTKAYKEAYEVFLQANEGKMIAVVPADQADAALAAMRNTEHGRNAAVIGRVKEGEGAFIRTRLGATRRFDVLYGEGLPRIC